MPAFVELKDSLEALIRCTISESPEIQQMYDKLQLNLADIEVMIVFKENIIGEAQNSLRYEQRVFVYLLEEYMHVHPRWHLIEALRKKVLAENKSLPYIGMNIKPSARQTAVTQTVLRIEGRKPPSS